MLTTSTKKSICTALLLLASACVSEAMADSTCSADQAATKTGAGLVCKKVVNLQTATPGTAQTGNVNINTGTAIAGAVRSPAGNNALVVKSGDNGAGRAGNLTLDVGSQTSSVGIVEIGRTNATDVYAGHGSATFNWEGGQATFNDIIRGNHVQDITGNWALHLTDGDDGYLDLPGYSVITGFGSLSLQTSTGDISLGPAGGATVSNGNLNLVTGKYLDAYVAGQDLLIGSLASTAHVVTKAAGGFQSSTGSFDQDHAAAMNLGLVNATQLNLVPPTLAGSAKNAGCVNLVSGTPSTKTVTVTATSHCVCSPTTPAVAAAGVPYCAVVGTTLTITGPNTNTDSVCYLCF